VTLTRTGRRGPGNAHAWYGHRNVSPIFPVKNRSRDKSLRETIRKGLGETQRPPEQDGRGIARFIVDRQNLTALHWC